MHGLGVPLPIRSKPVSCMGLQNETGHEWEVEHYKGRLVARGFIETYEVKIFISCFFSSYF
jgi:hypothetical protein